MRLVTSLAVLLAAWLPVRALAQDGFGLDLSDGPAKGPTPETPTRAPVAAESRMSEVDLAAEDRVKSVARKAFLKRERFDLLPLAFLSVNDAFFPKFGPGLRASYHLHEAFALGLRFLQFNKLPNDNARLAKRQLQSSLPVVLPKLSVALDALWSPIYGKVAVGNTIRHFDLYLAGGAGAVWSQTSGGEAPTGGDGMHLSAHFGVGQRFTLTDWMAVDLLVLDTLYADRPNGQNKSVLQQLVTLQAGVSFFLPVGFEYREP